MTRHAALTIASENRLTDEKISMTICRNMVQTAMHKRNPTPNGRTRVLAWSWLWLLLFFGGCIILCLGTGTAAHGMHSMQWEPPAGRPNQAVRVRHCEIILSRSNTPCFDISTDSNAAIAQRVWTFPVETESTETESAPKKFNIIYSVRPLGIACPGYLSLFPKRISRRLYLYKKSLLY